VTAHAHAEYVDGCYRCDLSRDEVDDFVRAEQGACLLVAMGVRLVSVIDAVVWYRAQLAPRTLWDAA
jgi:hypothetical protein